MFGAYKAKWGPQRLEKMKAALRSVTIVPYDWRICQTYGELKTKLQELGKTVADNDLWIASCAVRHSIPLVSNNRSHFDGIPGLVLVSEAPVIQQIESQGNMFQKATGDPPKK